MNKAAQKKLYREAAIRFIAAHRQAGLRCPVTGREVSQIHHSRGRLGSLLLNEKYWVAVSAAGHDWIHRNIADARKRGLICQKGFWNSQKVVVDNVT